MLFSEKTAIERTIKRNRRLLIKHVKIEDIIGFLITEGALSTDDQESIASRESPEEKMRQLIKIILTQGPTTYEMFRKSLGEKYSWMVEILDEAPSPEPVQGTIFLSFEQFINQFTLYTSILYFL